MTATKLKRAPWAKRAGLAESTLRNFMNRDSNSLSHGSLEQLAEAIGQPVTVLMGEGPTDVAFLEMIARRYAELTGGKAPSHMAIVDADLNLDGGAKRPDAPFTAKNLRREAIDPGEKDIPLRVNVRAVRVIGAVQGGVFNKAMEWPPEEQYDVMEEVAPAASRYPVFGLKVIGNSVNQEFRHGSTAICIKLFDLPDTYEVAPGQFVVVLRRSPDGLDEFEATIKEFQIDQQGRRWLCPKSDDPNFQTAIAVDSMEQGEDEFTNNEDVRIWAIVIGQHKSYGF